MRLSRTIDNTYTLDEACATCSNEVLFRNYEECQDCKKTVCPNCYKCGLGRCTECQIKQVAAVQAWASNGGSYEDLMRITKSNPISMVTLEPTTEKCGTCLVNPRSALSSDCVECYTPGEPPEPTDGTWAGLNCPPGESGRKLRESPTNNGIFDIYSDFNKNEEDFIRAETCDAVQDYEDSLVGVEI